MIENDARRRLVEALLVETIVASREVGGAESGTIAEYE
jgi:hypothetical protein